MINIEKERIKSGFITALSFLLVLWIIKLIEINFNISFANYGIFPRKESGLIGIIATPLLHKDLLHLFFNSAPLFISVMAIVYLFGRISTRILSLIWLLTGFMIWLFARGGSYHIGASGIVYAYLSFLFFFSTFSSNKNLLALSLIIIFLYGAMIWGILPVESEVSWESHLMGALIGFVFAIIYRKKGPPPETYDWENEEDNIDEMTDEEINELIDEKLKVKYWYLPKKHK